MALQITGNLVVTAPDNAVSGTSSFTDSTNAGITLDTLQSDGAVTVSGGTTTIDNDSALALQGSVTGNLVVTSGGAISDSAALAVSGTSSFTDSTNAGITLDSLQSDGAVTVSGGTTTIDNDSALALQGSITGNLVVTSGGAISDSAALAVSGHFQFHRQHPPRSTGITGNLDSGTLQLQ